MILQLIYNPASGTHDEARLDRLVQAFQASGTEVLISQSAISGDIAIAPERDLICLSGGDGALRLLVAQMVARKIAIPICIFPAGTVNLIAKELGYASDPVRFAQQVATGFTQTENRCRAPVITSDSQAFVACLSAGPDGTAVATYSPALKKRIGGLAYGVSLIKLLFDWPQQQYALDLTTVDGRTVAISCGAFYVAKGRYYAGNWTLAPDAALTTDHFHLLALTTASRFQFLRFLIQVACKRDPAHLKFVISYVGQTLRIEHGDNDQAQNFQIDGDPVDQAPRDIAMTDHVIEYCLPVSTDINSSGSSAMLRD
jgi:diacylglycerol kinase family enzyme